MCRDKDCVDGIGMRGDEADSVVMSHQAEMGRRKE